MLNISLHEILGLVKLASTQGVAEYIRRIAPEKDRMTRRETKHYVKMCGFMAAMVDKWTEAGLLSPVKAGTAKTSPVYYSRAEVDRLITAVRLKQICNK